MLHRTQVVGPLLQHLRARGIDPAPLVEKLGLPASVERDPFVTLELERYYALQDEAEALTGDIHIGIHLAERHRRGTFQLLEYLCRSAATLAEGFELLSQAVSLINDTARITLERKGDLAVLRHQMLGAPLAAGRHSNEYIIAFLVLQARALTGRDFRPTRAWFAHPRTDGIEVVAFVLGCDCLDFGVGSNGMEFPSAALDWPLESADPTLHALPPATMSALPAPC